MVENCSAQRISRLTPLKAVRDVIDARVAAVIPQRRAIDTAYGHTLADDVVASKRPRGPIALRDGFAVDSTLVADAGSYAPIGLPAATRRIDVGEPLPAGSDAVLPLDAVVLRERRAEAIAPAVAGEGVLPAAADVTTDAPLRRAGERVRAVDLAIMRAAGIRDVSVRVPKIHVVWGGDARSEPIEAALAAIGRFAAAAGGAIIGRPVALEPALGDSEADAVIAVGGTGSGRRDAAVKTLARLGRLEMHGIAISPGETAAFGFVETRPVLLVPGRLDAALAVWLLIGRHLVAKLAEGRVEDWSTPRPLKRKVASTIGLAELVPVSAVGGTADPLASGYLSLTALARSDGWIVVPADSEGFAEGTPVAVRPWP